MFYFHAPGFPGDRKYRLVVQSIPSPEGKGDREAVEEEYGRKPNSCNVFRLTPG